MSSAVKLSTELVESARHESRVYSRSMTQQIEHWARIGRAVERTGVLASRIHSALKAELAFDELTTEERVVVLAELEALTHAPDGNADLAAALASGER